MTLSPRPWGSRTNVSTKTNLAEGDFSVEVLDLVADESLLVEVECERVEAENQSRHVLPVVDVGGFRKEDLREEKIEWSFAFIQWSTMSLNRRCIAQRK